MAISIPEFGASLVSCDRGHVLSCPPGEDLHVSSCTILRPFLPPRVTLSLPSPLLDPPYCCLSVLCFFLLSCTPSAWVGCCYPLMFLVILPVLFGSSTPICVASWSCMRIQSLFIGGLLSYFLPSVQCLVLHFRASVSNCAEFSFLASWVFLVSLRSI